MGVSNTRAKHKGRPIGSKIRGILVYRIPERISRLLLYNQDYQKLFVAINTIFLMKTI